MRYRCLDLLAEASSFFDLLGALSWKGMMFDLERLLEAKESRGLPSAASSSVQPACDRMKCWGEFWRVRSRSASSSSSLFKSNCSGYSWCCEACGGTIVFDSRKEMNSPCFNCTYLVFLAFSSCSALVWFCR